MAREQTQESPFAADEATEPEVPVDSEGRPQYEPKDVVLDGAPAPPKPASASPPESEPTDEGAAELQRQLNRETQARQRAEIAARVERDRAIMAERQTIAFSSSAIDQAIESATRAADEAQAKMERDLTGGAYADVARTQRELSRIEANLLRLYEQKQYVDQQARMPPQREVVQSPPQEIPQSQRIAATLDQTGYPKSAAWIRAHPEMVSDQKGVNRVDGAHSYVVNVKGLVPETPEYFALLEETLDMRAPAEEPEVRQNVAPVRRAEPRAAAPVNGRTPNLSGRRSQDTVHLSAAQVEHARDVLGMSEQEYARSLLEAEANGRLLGGARR